MQFLAIQTCSVRTTGRGPGTLYAEHTCQGSSQHYLAWACIHLLALQSGT